MYHESMRKDRLRVEELTKELSQIAKAESDIKAAIAADRIRYREGIRQDKIEKRKVEHEQLLKDKLATEKHLNALKEHVAVYAERYGRISAT